MAQEPFTAAGVGNKQAELYALPQAALDIQADLIQSRFKVWVGQNFLPNTEQAGFLNQLSGSFLYLVSGESSDVVRKREPVQLIFTNPGGVKSSKRFKIRRCKWSAYYKNDTSGEGGELLLEVVYDPE